MFLVCMVKCVTICSTQFQTHSTDISALFHGKLLIDLKTKSAKYSTMATSLIISIKHKLQISLK